MFLKCHWLHELKKFYYFMKSNAAIEFGGLLATESSKWRQTWRLTVFKQNSIWNLNWNRFMIHLRNWMPNIFASLCMQTSKSEIQGTSRKQSLVINKCLLTVDCWHIHTFLFLFIISRDVNLAQIQFRYVKRPKETSIFEQQNQIKWKISSTIQNLECIQNSMQSKWIIENVFTIVFCATTCYWIFYRFNACYSEKRKKWNFHVVLVFLIKNHLSTLCIVMTDDIWNVCTCLLKTHVFFVQLVLLVFWNSKCRD